MEEQTSEMRNTQQLPLRPGLLAVCVLSICAIVVASLTDICFMFYASMPRQQIEEMLALSGQELPTEQIDMVLNIVGYGVYHMIFNVVELVGVVLLLMRKFVGFHFYAASQIGYCAVSYMAFGIAGSMSLIFINLMWVVLYFLLSRYLGAAQIKAN